MSGRELGLAIAFLREDRTQTECARVAGINPATWSLYEAGKRAPREAALQKVVKGLGCSRLELESVAWSLRRMTLEREDSGPPIRQREPGELLQRLVTLFEELLFLVAQGADR